ncbi:Pr6Pr family membrane protein [Arthrobacter sp. H20]|uniref:Pr6Pr family membrane protein n=1 Tax=Arthrobacter sp. H20 TaxID=1267981 RepID=UPI0004B62B8B|nr:Pr6Pr family membrane protein [Arthrobacter sp. H20]
MVTAARSWHGVVALIGLVGLGAQVTALINGENYSLLGPAMSWWNFFSYFTILSNILVLAINADLARNPSGRSSTLWRVLRLNAVVNISVTGLIAFTLLRRLPEVQALVGLGRLSDTLLHYVVPILTVLGWLLFGPRPRFTIQTVWLSLTFPAVGLVYTLIRGAMVTWYQYPFVDLRIIDPLEVFINCIFIGAMFVGFGFAVLQVDNRMKPKLAEEATHD